MAFSPPASSIISLMNVSRPATRSGSLCTTQRTFTRRQAGGRRLEPVDLGLACPRDNVVGLLGRAPAASPMAAIASNRSAMVSMSTTRLS